MAMEQIKGIMDKCKEHHGELGFSVQFSSDPVKFGEHSVLKFDKVLINSRGCYSPSNGVFTAPYTGVYDFYFTGYSAGGDIDKAQGFTDVVIEKADDAHPLCHCHLKPYAKHYWLSQGTDHVTAKLNKGERVHVRHRRGDPVIRGQIHSGFSGCLMQIYHDPS